MTTAGDLSAELSKLEKGYELLGELSRDDVVAVYVARDRLSGNEVAVKVLRAADARGREALAHYASDARMLTALEHPNIVNVHAVKWLSENVVAVITERVGGPSLRQVLDVAGTLPVTRATEVLKSVGRALAWAHSTQIMHRDVRPENVIFEDGTGRVVLSDFGLARGVQAQTAVTNADAYRAPELADGRYPDRRTDVYSLGLVGWELLTGRRPWPDTLAPPAPGERWPAPPPLAAVRPGLPEALVSAIEGAVQLDRDRRIPDVTSFLERLTGVTAPPRPVPEADEADAFVVEPSQWVALPVPKLPTRPSPSAGTPAADRLVVGAEAAPEPGRGPEREVGREAEREVDRGVDRRIDREVEREVAAEGGLSAAAAAAASPFPGASPADAMPRPRPAAAPEGAIPEATSKPDVTPHQPEREVARAAERDADVEKAAPAPPRARSAEPRTLDAGAGATGGMAAPVVSGPLSPPSRPAAPVDSKRRGGKGTGGQELPTQTETPTSAPAASGVRTPLEPRTTEPGRPLVAERSNIADRPTSVSRGSAGREPAGTSAGPDLTTPRPAEPERAASAAAGPAGTGSPPTESTAPPSLRPEPAKRQRVPESAGPQPTAPVSAPPSVRPQRPAAQPRRAEPPVGARFDNTVAPPSEPEGSPGVGSVGAGLAAGAAAAGALAGAAAAASAGQSPVERREEPKASASPDVEADAASPPAVERSAAEPTPPASTQRPETPRSEPAWSPFASDQPAPPADAPSGSPSVGQLSPLSAPVRGHVRGSPSSRPPLRTERMRGGLGTPRAAWGERPGSDPLQAQPLPPLDPVFDTPAEFPLPVMPDPRPMPPDTSTLGGGARSRWTRRGVAIAAGAALIAAAGLAIARMERAPDNSGILIEPESPIGYGGDVEMKRRAADTAAADTTAPIGPASATPGGAPSGGGRRAGSGGSSSLPGQPAPSSASRATPRPGTPSSPAPAPTTGSVPAGTRAPPATNRATTRPSASTPTPGRTSTATSTVTSTPTTRSGAAAGGGTAAPAGATSAPARTAATPTRSPAVNPARTWDERAEGFARCNSPALADQRACISAHLARNDAGLNQVYNDVIAAMRRRANTAPGDPDPPEVQRLRASQRSWIGRRDAECRRRGRGREGPLWAPQRAQCLEEVSQARARDLSNTLARLR